MSQYTTVKSKGTRKEKYLSEDDDVLFLKCAKLPVRYIGLKLVRKMKTLRYRSGHDSYIRATNKVIKEGDFTGKESQAEKRAKKNPKKFL